MPLPIRLVVVSLPAIIITISMSQASTGLIWFPSAAFLASTLMASGS